MNSTKVVVSGDIVVGVTRRIQGSVNRDVRTLEYAPSSPG